MKRIESEGVNPEAASDCELDFTWVESIGDLSFAEDDIFSHLHPNVKVSDPQYTDWGRRAVLVDALRNNRTNGPLRLAGVQVIKNPFEVLLSTKNDEERKFVGWFPLPVRLDNPAFKTESNHYGLRLSLILKSNGVNGEVPLEFDVIYSITPNDPLALNNIKRTNDFGGTSRYIIETTSQSELIESLTKQSKSTAAIGRRAIGASKNSSTQTVRRGSGKIGG